jgi:hypothetical protein
MMPLARPVILSIWKKSKKVLSRCGACAGKNSAPNFALRDQGKKTTQEYRCVEARVVS